MKKTGIENRWDKQKAICKMLDLKPSILIILLNVNGPNIPSEMQKSSDWI